MPDTSPIYQKSDKGTQAIATRDHSLGPKLRSLLIMVDGKRSQDELGKLASVLGDTTQLLAQLLQQGLIEPAAARAAAASPSSAPPSAATTAATTAAPPAAASPSGEPAPGTLAEAKRFAVRRLTDALGPMGESLCLRIEATRNAQEFLQQIAKAENILRDFGGAKVADAFALEMQARRPA